MKDPLYGAVGDGLTDDTVAIQRAVNAAFEAGGGIVYMPSSRYLIDGGPFTPPSQAGGTDGVYPGTTPIPTDPRTGSAYVLTGLVPPNNGNPVPPEAARISTTRLHDTRHTAATHLIVGGTDIRTAASVLGHATPTVTLSIYAHLVADAQRAAVQLLGARLERICAKGNQMATVTPLTAKNARKTGRSLVEARRLELLTLTLPA